MAPALGCYCETVDAFLFPALPRRVAWAVSGVLPAAIHAHAHDRGLVCPAACGGEAAWVKGLEVLAAPSLMELINHFKGAQVIAVPEPRAEAEVPDA